jgi:hypothetical protein
MSQTPLVLLVCVHNAGRSPASATEIERRVRRLLGELEVRPRA